MHCWHVVQGGSVCVWRWASLARPVGRVWMSVLTDGQVSMVPGGLWARYWVLQLVAGWLVLGLMWVTG